MKGSYLMGGMLVFAVAFGGALWYAQNYAYYNVTTPDAYTIPMTLAGGGTQPILGRGYTVLDAKTSPLKFRACFKAENSIPMMTETYRVYTKPTPLEPPSWFSCFDVKQLTDDLETGKAVAFLSKRNFVDGVDQVVAVYDDGRAYAWRQLNEKYADK